MRTGRGSWHVVGLAAAAAFGCSVGVSGSPEAALGSEEDRVVQVVLDSLFSELRQPKLLVHEWTMRELTREHLPTRYWEALRRTPAATADMVASFEAANRSPRLIKRLAGTHRVVEIVSDSTIEAAVRGRSGAEEHWRKIFARFPEAGAIVRLSRVGFTESGLRAVLEVQYGCGALCGRRAFVVVAKEEGEWRVTEVNTTLVS